jgi:serine/threonine-protein kinase RsbW
LRKGEITLSIGSSFRDVFLVGLAVNKIAAFAQVGSQSAFGIEVAVVEAVNNAIEHAHHQQPNKRVAIQIYTYPDRIKVTIIDRGAPIDFTALMAASANLKDEAKLERGRGLGIMRRLIDDVAYHRVGNTNQIVLVKYLDDKKRTPLKE